MTRCVIHVGMHKTGSTSIQESLRGFSDSRFLYPVLGGAANHSLAIYSLFSSRPEIHHLHRAQGRDAAAVRAFNRAVETDLQRAIDEARGRTLLLSGEDIGVLPQRDLETLREYFRRRVDRIEIVAYVRPPAGFMASSFQQRVKGGLAEWPGIERTYRNYRGSFGKLDAVFGRENVHLWKFDPKSFPQGCAVRDFCSRLGIALPETRILRLNESLSRQAVGLLYVYRKFGARYGAGGMRGPESQALGAVLSELGCDKFRFSPEVVRPILEKHRADIEWMEARLGQSLQEDLGEHRPGDVQCEADLLAVDPATVSGLLALLGAEAPQGVKGETPEEVARLVHALRMKQRRVGAAQEQQHRLTPGELVRRLRQDSPGALSGIPARQAEALVRVALRCVGRALAETGSDVFDCPGLGRFRVRRVQNEMQDRSDREIRMELSRPKTDRGHAAGPDENGGSRIELTAAEERER